MREPHHLATILRNLLPGSGSRTTLTVFLAGCAVALAGCGGSGSAHGPNATQASSATVITEHVPGYGTVLATPSGQELYVLTADPQGGSKCAGRCTSQWHPLIDKDAPTAGPGVNQSLLSTFKRTDGRAQVLYNDHALYTYTGSGVAGGAGVTADGGVWFLISPAGKAIEQTTSGGY